MSTFCIAVGPFGRAVAEELDHIGEIADLYELPRLTPDLLRKLPIADEYILATCGRYPRQLASPSPAVCRWQTGFLPIVYDHPNIIVGPRSGVGGGTCGHCRKPLRQQHGQAPAARRGPGRVDGGHVIDPVGFLPPTATIAAHAAASLLSQRSPLRGDYIVLGALTLSVERRRSVGVPGCPSCAADRDGTAHTLRDLHMAVGEPPCRRGSRAGGAPHSPADRLTTVGSGPGSPPARSTGGR